MRVPGLVDLQVNGFLGVDFSSPALEKVAAVRACRDLLASGTTAFLPTMITSAAETYERNLPILAEVVEMAEFRGRLLGLHLEGPFISAEDGARGAHGKDWVAEPDLEYLERLLALAAGNVRMLTLAAELPAAELLARHATQQGVTVALGHQTALEADLARLAGAGARVLTHLGNGIPAMLPRHANPVWAGLANDDLHATFITDGHHLPASLIKCFLRMKGVSRSVVVSDAAPLAGLPPGRYETLGNNVILEESGRLYNPQTGYLVGSSKTMLDCMNYLGSLHLLDAQQLLAVCFHNPLALIGVDPGEVAASNVVLDAENHVFRLAEQH